MKGWHRHKWTAFGPPQKIELQASALELLEAMVALGEDDREVAKAA